MHCSKSGSDSETTRSTYPVIGDIYDLHPSQGHRIPSFPVRLLEIIDARSLAARTIF